MKFVLLSIVVVPAPSGRLRNAPIAPSVSANAMMAPPCRMCPEVQRSVRTARRPRIFSFVASRSSTPIRRGKGCVETGSFIGVVSPNRVDGYTNAMDPELREPDLHLPAVIAQQERIVRKHFWKRFLAVAGQIPFAEDI